MNWVSTVSTESLLEAAVRDAAAALRTQLGGLEPNLIVVFVSAHHYAAFEQLPRFVTAHFAAGLLIGCSAGGVIGGGKEIEQGPGLSMTAAALPGVELTPFHIEVEELPQQEDPDAWEELLGTPAARQPHFLLLPDPFTFDPETFVRGLDRAYPGSQKIGGLASGGTQPGSNALFLGPAAGVSAAGPHPVGSLRTSKSARLPGGDVYRSGLVGVALAGDIQIDTIVAQGCRPIGQPMFITKCDGHLLGELDGQRAVAVLQDLYQRLPAADQELARHSLFLGIVMSEDQQQYRQGDFLIRNIMGLDATRGVLVIGARLQDNSVVQFHLRDAKTSADDLDVLLSGYETAAQAPPQGALLFSCLGRGMHLYGRPDHDTDAFRRHLGDVALGGFFCNGEIGPVHGTTFLHGYTSAFGLFRSRTSGPLTSAGSRQR
jgi:small ligand-binding sensory domain FIST